MLLVKALAVERDVGNGEREGSVDIIKLCASETLSMWLGIRHRRDEHFSPSYYVWGTNA